MSSGEKIDILGDYNNRDYKKQSINSTVKKCI